MNELLTKFHNAKNIFDLIVEIYLSVNTCESPLFIKNYTENLKNGTYERSFYQDIAQIIDELLDNMISFETFKDIFSTYISEKLPDEYAVWMLVYMDQVFSEYDQYPLLKQHLKLSSGKLGTMGPLNTAQQNYLLY